MRQLGEMRLEIRRVESLQRLADAAVQHQPPWRAELLVQGVTNQRVREIVRPARRLEKHLGAERFLKGVEQGPVRLVADRLQLCPREAGRHRGGRRQHVVRRSAQPR